MGSVYKKELRSYFTNMTGYIPMALILIMTGIFVKLYCFDYGYPNMEVALPDAVLILLIAVPILAMRSFSEERRQKTDLLLYALPISTADIVAGKYLAMMTVLAVPTAIMMLIPLLLSAYGTVNILMSVSSILAFYFLCAAMTAICMFMSSLTESQVIAAVLGAGSLIVLYASTLISAAIPTTAIASFIALTILILLAAFVVYVFTKNYWVSFTVAVVLEAVTLIFYISKQTSFEGLIQRMIEKASIFARLDNFVYNQLFDLTALIYYASIAFLFCYLTYQTVEKKRWN